MIPMVIARYVEAAVSFKRLTNSCVWTNCQKISFFTDKISSKDYSLTMKILFLHGHRKRIVSCQNPDLKKRGDLVCLIGVVGCGKTSLLSSILAKCFRSKDR